MEDIQIAVYRFPCVGNTTPTLQQYTRYLTDSKAVIAWEVLSHPNVASVDFDGFKLRSITGTLDLVLREINHTFTLVAGTSAEAGVDCGRGRKRTRSWDGSQYKLVSSSPPQRQMVQELMITYEVTVAT